MLTPRKKAFVDNYLLTKNGAEAARLSGYSVKTARQAASRLLTNADVKEAIEAVEAEKQAKWNARKEQLSKESFVETAWNHFKSEEEPSVKPRYLEIAGRALGYLSKDDSKSAVNNLIINVDPNTLSTSARWDKLRALIDGQ